MKRVITFGEMMLRLKSPGHERLFQSPSLETNFSGSEGNVAVALANYGLDSAFVTLLPDNEITAACIGEMRRFGVDTSSIVKAPGQSWAVIYGTKGLWIILVSKYIFSCVSVK